MVIKVIAIIASAFFPPLGVLIRRGFSKALAINCLLTLLMWLPGFLHALYHSVKDDRVVAPGEEEIDERQA